MIKLDRVCHAYGRGARKVQSLEEVSIEIGDEFLAIVGPSGSGKSTLLKILAGFEQPSSGEVVWDGTPRTAMVFQDYSLLPWLTVRKNVELYLRLHGAGPAERARVSETLMAQLGLTAYADLLPHELSGGMQQRVAIGRAFAQSPDVLLMDEPFGALDAMTRADAQSVLLRVHAERRCTVIFVTHDVEEALILSDRIVVLTPRPARVAEIVTVPFTRPRAQDLRWTSNFVDLRRKVVSIMRREISSLLDRSDKSESGV
ncbi:MAG TPA: ABC transporter ATP-binding protein [Beijerinckiaceae bacterium]|jgi:NitT/TauT family transport system ATP-binding protein